MAKVAAYRALAPRVVPDSPEEALLAATRAADPVARVRVSRAALRRPAPREPGSAAIDALLYRELHRGLFALGLFAEAEQAARVGAALAREAVVEDEDESPFADVLLQGAVRAALARGDGPAALTYAAEALREAPRERRGFHGWTYGSLLFLAKRYTEAERALTHATRLAADPGARALYSAHRALVAVAKGEPPPDLQAIVDALLAAPTAHGYGRFVLGHLAYAAGDFPTAERLLRAFLKRAKDPALAGEARMSEATLAKITEG